MLWYFSNKVLFINKCIRKVFYGQSNSETKVIWMIASFVICSINKKRNKIWSFWFLICLHSLSKLYWFCRYFEALMALLNWFETKQCTMANNYLQQCCFLLKSCKAPYTILTTQFRWLVSIKFVVKGDT